MVLWFAALFPTAAAWLYFVTLREHAGAPLAYAGAKVVQFLLPIPAILRLAAGRRTLSATGRDSRRDPAPAAQRWRELGTGLLWGGALSAGVVAARLLLNADPALDQVRRAVQERLATFSLDSPSRYLAFALFLSIAHSGLEEYYWRWYLSSGIATRTGSPSRAALLSSLAFTSHHVVIIAGFVPSGRLSLVVLGSLGVFVGGMVWARLYLSRRSLVAPWLSHAVVDLAVLGLGWELVTGNLPSAG